jgi:hypothetical protein
VIVVMMVAVLIGQKVKLISSGSSRDDGSGINRSDGEVDFIW